MSLFVQHSERGGWAKSPISAFRLFVQTTHISNFSQRSGLISHSAAVSLLIALAVLVSSCSLINDDLSVCPTGEDSIEVNYSLSLTTSLTVELSEEINLETETALYTDVADYLSDIFTDHAHDVDLRFFHLTSEDLKHSERHIIDANQKSLTIQLPADDYMHLAVANIERAAMVEYADNELSSAAALYTRYLPQVRTAPRKSHTAGIFTARQQMQVTGNESQHFDVTLYMANCATVLVLDTVGSGCTAASMQVEGMATDFAVRDSIYSFEGTQPMLGEPFTSHTERMLFAAVSFPSDTVQTANGMWQVRIETYNKDDKRCETILSMPEPLRAGRVKVIRARVDEQGAVRTESTDIGVTVTLDWKSGGEHEIDL